MKKRVMWYCLLSVLVLAIAGCEDGYTGDFPPEPGAPGALTEEVSGDIAGRAHYTYEQGYASPYDVYEPEDESNPLKNLLFPIEKASIDILADTSNTFTFPVKVTHPGGYVYRYGYIYKKTGCSEIPYDWVMFDLAQGQTGGKPRPCVSPTDPNRCALISSLTNKQYLCVQGTPNPNNQLVPNTNYVKVQGTEYKDISLTLNKADFDLGENYIVAHSCKKHNDIWRCGMQVKDGAGGKWMLQKFTVLQGAPPEPSGPGAGLACVDSDQGKTYDTPGYTDFTGMARETDSCIDTNTLKEWYCEPSGTSVVRKSVDPPVVCNTVLPGTTCIEGACKAPTTATLTVAKDASSTGTGTVTSTPSGITCGSTCNAPFTIGTSVTLTATPDAGGTAAWSTDSGCDAGTAANVCTVTLQTAKTATVKFTAATPTTFAVCQIPLADPLSNPSSPSVKTWIRTEFPIKNDPADATKKIPELTADQLKAKCAGMFIFGTSGGNPVSVDAQTIVAEHALTGTIYETIVCKATCASGLSTIQRCKFISEIPDGQNGQPTVAPDSAASNAYYNTVPPIVPNPTCA